MRNKLKTLLIMSIILNSPLSISYAQENLKPETYIQAIGSKGLAIYVNSIMYQARDLSFNIQKVVPFFEKHPEQYVEISYYILDTLSHPANVKIYNRYKKLAEFMGLEGIPLYKEKIQKN
jgi:hypothetical protein